MRELFFAARENVRFAGVALSSHKLRSSLTILGIVIGVTTVIAMVSLIEGFNNQVEQNFGQVDEQMARLKGTTSQFVNSIAA